MNAISYFMLKYMYEYIMHGPFTCIICLKVLKCWVHLWITTTPPSLTLSSKMYVELHLKILLLSYSINGHFLKVLLFHNWSHCENTTGHEVHLCHYKNNNQISIYFACLSLQQHLGVELSCHMQLHSRQSMTIILIS